MARKPAGAPTKRTNDASDRILKILGAGGTWRMAAAAGCISEDTLKRWRDDDADFADLCTRARDSGAAKLVERIRAEAENGDWRAATWLLERIAPEQYGRKVQIGGDPENSTPVRIEQKLDSLSVAQLRKLADGDS